jgi:hypothetical protein
MKALRLRRGVDTVVGSDGLSAALLALVLLEALLFAGLGGLDSAETAAVWPNTASLGTAAPAASAVAQ